MQPRTGDASAVDATARQILDLIRSRGLARRRCAADRARALRPLRRQPQHRARGAAHDPHLRPDRRASTRRRRADRPAERRDPEFFAAQMDVSRSTFRDIQGFRRIIEVGIGDQLVLQCHRPGEIEDAGDDQRPHRGKPLDRGGRAPRLRFPCRADPARRQPHACRDLRLPVPGHPAHHDDRQGDAPGAWRHAAGAQRDRRGAFVPATGSPMPI